MYALRAVFKDLTYRLDNDGSFSKIRNLLNNVGVLVGIDEAIRGNVASARSAGVQQNSVQAMDLIPFNHSPLKPSFFITIEQHEILCCSPVIKPYNGIY